MPSKSQQTACEKKNRFRSLCKGVVCGLVPVVAFGFAIIFAPGHIEEAKPKASNKSNKESIQIDSESNKDDAQMSDETEDKSYVFSDFTKAKIGMAYEDVVESIGEPTGSIGSGIEWKTYGLKDGSYMKMLMGGMLTEMAIVDRDERKFFLRQISDFTKVKIGMTYDEVVKNIGKPISCIDSSGMAVMFYYRKNTVLPIDSICNGFAWDAHILNDGSYTKIFFDRKRILFNMFFDDRKRTLFNTLFNMFFDGRKRTVSNMSIVDIDGREFILGQIDTAQPACPQGKFTAPISSKDLFANKKKNIAMNDKTVDKSYIFSDFTKAKIGMTYDEVVKNIGKPTSSTGSRFIWDTYRLNDGSYMKMFFDDLDGKKTLSMMSIVDIEGREFALKASNFRMKNGMTYDEIVKGIGKPTDSTGSGFIWDTYRFNEHYYMKMFFAGKERTLYMMAIDNGWSLDENKRSFILSASLPCPLSP